MRGLWAIPILLVVAGCGTSRWAMDDPEYAAKYSRPYGNDKIPRMAKQAIDARHVGGKTGLYIGGAGQSSPFTAGGDLGVMGYWTPCLSGHLGLTGIAGTGVENIFAGVDFGVRAQTPTRLAPFAGVGATAGYAIFQKDWADDGIDNDGDGNVDEPGEHDFDRAALAAVYPETGVHFWLNGQTRLTASGRYMVTTDGRSSDFWYYGLSLAFLFD